MTSAKAKPHLVTSRAETIEDKNNDKKEMIACSPKWYNYLLSLPVKRKYYVDTALLREKVKSPLLKDCRPDLYEQIDRSVHEESKVAKLTLGSKERLIWICFCGAKWEACIDNRSTSRNSACKKCVASIDHEKMRLPHKEVEDLFASFNFKLLESYKGYQCAHKVLCLICNEEVTKAPRDVRYSGCGNCAIIKGVYHNKVSHEEASERYKKYNFKLLSQYKDGTTYDKVLCLKCNRETSKQLRTLGRSNCILCDIDAGNGYRIKITQEQAETGYLECNFKLLENYVNSHYPHKVLCLICNKETTKRWDGLGDGCRECKMSKGAVNVQAYLNEIKAEYKMEYTLPLLPSRKYDFMLIDRKTIIEFDGEQHFAYKGWYRDEDDFKELQEIDRRKTYAALLCGYKMVRLHNNNYDAVAKFLKYCFDDKSDECSLYVDNVQKYKHIIEEGISDGSVQKLGVSRDKLPNLKKIVKTL